MPEPIDYRIILSLQTALAAISVVSGYHYDVAAGAVKLDPNHNAEAMIAPDGPRPFILFELGDQQWTLGEYQPSNKLAHILPVTIAWIHDSDPADDTSLLKTFFRGAADVEHAIAGTEASCRRGGLATDTKITSVRLHAIGAQVWAITDLRILTHRVYGQPNG